MPPKNKKGGNAPKAAAAAGGGKKKKIVDDDDALLDQLSAENEKELKDLETRRRQVEQEREKHIQAHYKKIGEPYYGPGENAQPYAPNVNWPLAWKDYASMKEAKNYDPRIDELQFYIAFGEKKESEERVGEFQQRYEALLGQVPKEKNAEAFVEAHFQFEVAIGYYYEAFFNCYKQPDPSDTFYRLLFRCVQLSFYLFFRQMIKKDLGRFVAGELTERVTELAGRMQETAAAAAGSFPTPLPAPEKFTPKMVAKFISALYKQQSSMDYSSQMVRQVMSEVFQVKN